MITASVVFFLPATVNGIRGIWMIKHEKLGDEKLAAMALKAIYPMLLAAAIWLTGLLAVGIWLLVWPRKKSKDLVENALPVSEQTVQTVVSAPPVYSTAPKNRRWSSCNLLHIAPDAKRLWRFDAKGRGFVLGREQRVPHAEMLPAGWIAKSWSSLWQPKLNVAWLPSESVFLRVVELPAASADETFSMVELQLEKLSPIPITQIVWTMHVLGTHQSVAKADGTVESLQTVVVVVASRAMVEEFMGRLERDGFLADQLEVPMLDQLEAVGPKTDGIWLFPLTIGGQNAALVAWWFGGAWRNLSLVALPPAGDRAAELKNQLGLLAMAGEVDGWLTAQPQWHLVADPVNATEWEQLLRAAVNEPVQVVAPPSPAELARRSALRAATSASRVQLQPVEFSLHYREQFFDRLWLHGLGYVGLLYAIGLVIYFCAVGWEGYRAHGVESQVAAISGSYTSAMQLQAKLGVLQERSKLKFAALDCWQIVAEELPSSITLQRFSLANGQKLTLSGTAPQDQVNTLFDFNTTLKKKIVNHQPVFDPLLGDNVNPRNVAPNLYSWNLSLELLHTEAEDK
jgi:hypothetical protein